MPPSGAKRSRHRADRMGECKLCLKHKKLVDAHIVPRAFYPDRGDTVVLTKGESRVPRSRKGIYDSRILCADCDGEIGKSDDYAAKLLRPNAKRADLYRSDDGLIVKGEKTRWFAYWIRKPNVKKLQAFAASLAWRAGHTTRLEMSVKIPKDVLSRAERVMRGDASSFFFIVGTRCEEGRLSQFVARPTLFVSEPARGIQFYMNGFVLNVFEQRPPWPKTVEPVLLGHQPDWLIGYAPFWGSKFGETLREIVAARAGTRPAMTNG